ncbi:MAG: DUF1553 domain-containing protein [Pirellulales bacterium]
MLNGDDHCNSIDRQKKKARGKEPDAPIARFSPEPVKKVPTTATTPLQSLFWMNDPWVHEQSQRFAERLLRETSDDSQRLDRALLLLYARPPRDNERQTCLAHLALYRARLRESGITMDDEEARRAWSSLARVLPDVWRSAACGSSS